MKFNILWLLNSKKEKRPDGSVNEFGAHKTRLMMGFKSINVWAPQHKHFTYLSSCVKFSCEGDRIYTIFRPHLTNVIMCNYYVCESFARVNNRKQMPLKRFCVCQRHPFHMEMTENKWP